MTIGTLLRKNRNRCKLSGTEVADELGVTQGTYHNWESDKTGLPAKYLVPLAKIFNVEVIELLPEEFPPLTVPNQADNQEQTEVSRASSPKGPIVDKLTELIDLQKEAIRLLKKE
ncbi:helix-turn-helix domain-containing protein [Runella sp.]|uniref:helix-turn-helix domain-containing protein n=1 Tax=Runella sp. TaxID=1960881 RepID=UPI003D0C1BEB